MPDTRSTQYYNNARSPSPTVNTSVTDAFTALCRRSESSTQLCNIPEAGVAHCSCSVHSRLKSDCRRRRSTVRSDADLLPRNQIWQSHCKPLPSLKITAFDAVFGCNVVVPKDLAAIRSAVCVCMACVMRAAACKSYPHSNDRACWIEYRVSNKCRFARFVGSRSQSIALRPAVCESIDLSSVGYLIEPRYGISDLNGTNLTRSFICFCLKTFLAVIA